MNKFSRRALLHTAYGAAAFYAGLAALPASAATANRRFDLAPDPAGLLELPPGFSYSVVSQAGGVMTDGFTRPGRPDGMACFSSPEDPDHCILMRNHEMWPDANGGGAFGDDNELLSRISREKIYDFKLSGSPFLGGVTKAVYDLKSKRLLKDHLVLAGTSGNCAGGPTPWGSWLSCEESVVNPPLRARKRHGYVFEVPVLATGPIDPVPLKAMGRFAHEAAAIDLDTDIVYMTEDNIFGLFYRFLPDQKQNLAAGGQLQALAIKGAPMTDTRNWRGMLPAFRADPFPVGKTIFVEWVELSKVDAPFNDLAARGYARGAARFCRGEGIAYGKRPGEPGAVYFNCTRGGAAEAGQVWRYVPSREEGASGESKQPGTLTLLYESPSADNLDMCDNLAVAPWGDLILCEDGRGDQYLRGLTPAGDIYDFARYAGPGRSEFCGACFAPDGETMFVNLQDVGLTLAINGPWVALR